MTKKTISKRTAAINIAKANLQSPEYLINDIMQFFTTKKDYAALSKSLVPVLMKMKAKHLETILNGYLNEEESVHVKTT